MTWSLADSAAASEPGILAGLERWARLRGFVMHSRTGYDRNWKGGGWSIHVNPLPPRGSLLIVPDGVNELMGIEVSPALALAWALTVETDAASVDVGRCPDCDGRGRFWYDGEDCHPPGMVECPVCNSGRMVIAAARLLLDAVNGDARALEYLPKYADRLAFGGDPLGEALGLALGPWAGEPVDFGDCQRCEGCGRVDWGGFDTPAQPDRSSSPCPGCRNGRLLGHPHTAAALAWLGRLSEQAIGTA
jgi:hypothetical protein